LGDWLVAALLILQAFTIPVYLVPPVTRFIPKNDPSISYPHVAVPLTEAQKWLLLTMTPPLLGLLGNAPLLLARNGAPQGGGGVAAAVVDTHALTLASVMSFALECSLKKWMNLVGKPRPDYQWRLDHGLDVREGLFAYPSGHAAEMFAVGTVLALWLLGKARVLDASRPVRRWGGHLGAAVGCCVPWALATLVALSRVAGYRHDFSDVNAGMALGLCTGLLGYLLCYESPVGTRAGMVRGGGGDRQRRRKEEEEGVERPLLAAEGEGDDGGREEL
jgi:membrane-associated phospholipid phosphatase